MAKLAIEDIANFEWKYPEIEANLLCQISENHKEECLEIIKKYDEIIKKHFESDNNVKDFVDNLNEVLLCINYLNDFTAVDAVLTHKLFKKVITIFNESDILVKAFKKSNFYTIRNLLNDKNFNINYCICDENGNSALMIAAKHWKNVFAVESLLSKNRDSLFIEDKEGNTALYHSIHNINIFNRILSATKDINHVNNNNESIILYCGRKEAYISFDNVLKISDLSLEIKEKVFIEEGKREFPKMVESYNDKLLKYVAFQYQALSSVNGTTILENIIDEVGGIMMSTLIKKYYEAYMSGDKEAITNCIRMLKVLLFDLECDINGAIDEEGNTPLIFFLLIEDYCSVNYVLSCKTIDLSVKNKHGVSPSYLSIFIGDEEKKLRMKLLEHPTFDNFYLDSNKDNLITHFMVRNCYDEALKILSKSKYLLTVPNNKGETTIIIAVKSGHGDILQDKIFQNEGMNKQDLLGNTALHYAVQLKDKYALANLAHYGADSTIKNNDGLTAMDLANETKDEEILNLLNNPMEFLKKKSSSGGKFKKMFSKLKESSSSDISSSSSSNKKLIENYDYLFKNCKTMYSTSDSGKALIQKMNQIYLMTKSCTIEYVPTKWALFLTLSAFCIGTVVNEYKHLDTKTGAKYRQDTEKDGDFINSQEKTNEFELKMRYLMRDCKGFKANEYCECDGMSKHQALVF